MRVLALTLFVAAAGVLMLPAAAASARTTKGCPPRIHHKRFGGAENIRVTKSFPCRYARQSIRSWLADGAPGGPTSKELRPWTCYFRSKYRGSRLPIRCKIRTSFGGTKPLRLYRMRFFYNLSG